ncbi:hypothetical protein SLH46_08890 [Draconibacterium sp. IB214405]|uniref:hypothetical protein n=1 Tax=Draconibacterium sp. IB214405 TaxID=3097352 RepID=UPI002A0CCE9F|nr:hypothetical protein [Draconibacterium sp. IB214405]MDX8339294.1 hypothetical protein [Draconibacterium sp. IB214405]
MRITYSKQIIRNYITDIGISFVLIGVPLSMYLNYYFPVIVWSPVIMASSVVLIISYKNLFNLRLPLSSRIGSAIALFQLLMIIYGVFSDNMNSSYLSFHLYIIALFIALSTNPPRSSYQSTKTWIYIISSIATSLGAYTLIKGLISENTIFSYRENDENSIIDLLTMSYGFLINFIASLFMLGKNKTINILALLFIATDIYLMLFLGKRTSILIAFLSFILFIYIQPNFKLDILRVFFYSCILIILFIIIYTTNNQIKEQVDSVFLNIYLGIGVIFGNVETDLYGSAISRVNLRNSAYEMINSDFNLFNLLFGKGYMTIELDNPLLQSYVDMGIIGFILFFVLIVLYPIWIFIKSFKLDNSSIIYFYIFTIYNTLSAYHSGIPYAYIKYTPILLLAFIVRSNKYLNIQ